MEADHPARKAAVAAVIGLSLTLGACAAATPYQPIGPHAVSGGYSDVRLAPDRYRVNFEGNAFTSRDRVEGYLLYRAAELTTQQGYDWFRIEDRSTRRDVHKVFRPDPFYHPWYGAGYAYWTPSWRYYRAYGGWATWNPYWGGPFWASRVDVRTVQRFEATAEISLHHGAKPADAPGSFDARQVIANLGPTLERPTD